MQATLVWASLAVVGIVAAGRGSETTHTGTTRTATTHTKTATLAGTTTIAMRTGTPIHCKHGPGAKVPRPGSGVTGNADGPAASGEIQVTHRNDGSVVASCRSG